MLISLSRFCQAWKSLVSSSLASKNELEGSSLADAKWMAKALCLEHAVSPFVSNAFGPINILSACQSKSKRLGNQSRIIFPGTWHPAAATALTNAGTADWQQGRGWRQRSGRGDRKKGAGMSRAGTVGLRDTHIHECMSKLSGARGSWVSFSHCLTKSLSLFPLWLWSLKIEGTSTDLPERSHCWPLFTQLCERKKPLWAKNPTFMSSSWVALLKEKGKTVDERVIIMDQCWWEALPWSNTLMKGRDCSHHFIMRLTMTSSMGSGGKNAPSYLHSSEPTNLLLGQLFGPQSQSSRRSKWSNLGSTGQEAGVKGYPLPVEEQRLSSSVGRKSRLTMPCTQVCRLC